MLPSMPRLFAPTNIVLAGAKGNSAYGEDIGRSRGGLSTKIHAVVDA